MGNEMLLQVEEAVAFLKKKNPPSPKVGVVLGTGLGALVHKIEEPIIIPYKDIPGFPEATVEFHKGSLIFGTLHGVSVMAMQGRFHFYEGYSMQQITFPIRVMKAMGVEHLFLSNAAGGMNPSYKKGDLIVISDHINEQPENPLRGLNHPDFGNRFVDMCSPYNTRLSDLLLASAATHSSKMATGVYVAVAGPNLETRAEYRHLRQIGADMVGMSTVPEVIVANHIGLPCAAVSVITDECNPDDLQPVDIAEIIAVAGKADQRLSEIFATAIGQLG